MTKSDRSKSLQQLGWQDWGEATYDSTDPIAATNAVQQIGKNAIPTLLKMMSKRDSSFVSKLSGVWERRIIRTGFLPAWVKYPSWYRNQAAVLNREARLGFEILGSRAEQAVPALITIYNQNLSPNSQVEASHAIIAIGPAAQKMAIASLLRGAASPDPSVRLAAVWAFSDVEVEPRLVVPALLKAMGDSEIYLRSVAAKGLARVGTNAQQTVPDLIPMLNDSNARTFTRPAHVFSVNKHAQWRRR